MFRARFFGLALVSCTHLPEAAGPDAVTIRGHVEAQVASLDFLTTHSIPSQTRQHAIVVTLWGRIPGEKRDGYVQLRTGRDGWFQGSVRAGTWRITSLKVLGHEDATQRPVPRWPDLVMPLVERSIDVGFGGLQLRAPEEEALAPVSFTLTPGERRYLGHFKLEFREDPFEARPGCLTREVLIPGTGEAIWYSDRPIGAQLCVEQLPVGALEPVVHP